MYYNNKKNSSKKKKYTEVWLIDKQSRTKLFQVLLNGY